MVVELPAQTQIVKPLCKYRTPPEKKINQKDPELFSIYSLTVQTQDAPLSGQQVVLCASSSLWVWFLYSVYIVDSMSILLYNA